MKRSTGIFVLSVLAGFYAVKAQDTLYIYQSGMVSEKSAISEIDSMAFSLGPLILGRISDIEGNEYLTVQIGTQTWMAENLKTTKYNDGIAIPLATDNAAWSGLTTSGYCWYNNDSATYAQTYGALYNWYTVNTGNLCPTGWHVPTDAEWTTLTDYLGGESVAGGKLKETGYTHWNSPNTGATNETGFTALPGGYRSSNGTFASVGTYGYWWSATETNAENARPRYVYYLNSLVYRNYHDKRSGLSVRCVRD